MGVIGDYTHRNDERQPEDGTFVYGRKDVKFYPGDYVRVVIPVSINGCPHVLREGTGEIVDIIEHDGYYTALVRFIPWLSFNWRSGFEEYSGMWLTKLEEVDCCV